MPTMSTIDTALDRVKSSRIISLYYSTEKADYECDAIKILCC